MSAGTRIRLAAAALLAATLVAGPASAQGEPPVPYSRIISVNPLLLVFLGYVSVDYEQRIGPGATMGLSASNFSLSDADYLTIEAKARYYVSGRAFDGVSIGVLVSAVRLTEDDSTRFTSHALGIGFNAERQWLLGADERLALTAGAGATRLFFADDRDAFRTVIPSLRLSIGWGF